MIAFHGAPSGRSLAWCSTLLAAIVLPFLASSFVTQDILALAAWSAIVAMSMVFLSKYGGMISFAQVGIYGVGSYSFAILAVGHGVPWYGAVAGALVAATLCALLFALLVARTYGIYFLMVTLALGLVVYFLTISNYGLTHGSGGIPGVNPPHLGSISLAQPIPEYFLDASVAFAVLLGLTLLMRTQFGLALQGCRDNPRKMRAMGYSVMSYRVIAFTLAGSIAGIGGVLGVWYNGIIAPSYLDLTRIIDFLAIAVIGGMESLEGTFAGAIIYAIVTTYASSFTDRYNTVIGLVLLAIVMFAPGGVGGLVSRVGARLALAKAQLTPASTE